jgi:hypothetical protein
VAPLARCINGLDLVCIQALDTPQRQCVAELGRKRSLQLTKPWTPRSEPLHVHDLSPVQRNVLKASKGVLRESHIIEWHAKQRAT